MASAAILMATYNGEEFLPAQLESLIDQTFTNWKMYVSDDCSKDHTLDILREYQKKEQRICQIISNSGPHGPFQNYYNLMRYLKESGETFDYYFYCDQDDIWVASKMEKQIMALEKCPAEKPSICCCDLELIDEKGNLQGKRMSDYADIKLTNPYNLFFKHRYIWGTAMAHNRALWDLVEIPADISNDISHDNFLGNYAVAYGTIVFEPEGLVLYRRHGSNVSGLPMEHRIARDFLPMQFYHYYRAVCYTTLYFIHRAPYRTTFMNEYETAVLSGGVKAYRFLKKYQIHVTEGFLSRIMFYIVFVSGQVKREGKIKNREYLYEK